MGKKVIIACDFSSKEELEAFLKKMKGTGESLYCKVGMELFNSGSLQGFDPVWMIQAAGHKVFLDLKLKDIPNTVERTVSTIVNAGVDMINLHADGGYKMMRAAVSAIDQAYADYLNYKPLILGVTVLTSMEEQDLHEIGVHKTPLEQVVHLAKLCQQAGCDGVVCSPEEIMSVKEVCGEDFITVTPGIRFKEEAKNDQKRVSTPLAANLLGSDYIVVGRSITNASDSLAAYNKAKQHFSEKVTDVEEIEYAKNFIENLKQRVISSATEQQLPDYKRQFIEFAVKAGALKFGEFTLKSGRTSPYFFNAGNFATGKTLSKLAEYYAGAVQANICMPDVVLFGPAYKGIPLVSITAAKLAEKYDVDYPICYNRKEVKDHGEGGSTIGTELHSSNNIVAIEDVVTAGTAIRETKTVLAGNGGSQLRAVVIAVDRFEVINEGDSKTALQTIGEQEGIEVIPIVTIHEILNYLYNREIDGKIYIGDSEKQAIENYLSKYGAQSEPLTSTNEKTKCKSSE